MGKGDKKTKRGKIIMGSYGASRLRKKRKGQTVEAKATGKSPAKEEKA